MLVHCLDAIGAELDALAVYFCPLEVGILFTFVCWIVMTTQKLTSSGHDWFFAALRTSSCHSFLIVNYGFICYRKIYIVASPVVKVPVDLVQAAELLPELLLRGKYCGFIDAHHLPNTRCPLFRCHP